MLTVKSRVRYFDTTAQRFFERPCRSVRDARYFIVNLRIAECGTPCHTKPTDSTLTSGQIILRVSGKRQEVAFIRTSNHAEEQGGIANSSCHWANVGKERNWIRR